MIRPSFVRFAAVLASFVAGCAVLASGAATAKVASTPNAVLGASQIGAAVPKAARASTAAASDPLTDVGLPTAAGSSDPSGADMPTNDVPGWTEIYSDNFTTSVPVGGFSGCRWPKGQGLLSSNTTCSGLPASVQNQIFAYPNGWPDTSGEGEYEPSTVLSIHDGVLDYYLHHDEATNRSAVAAVVPKIPGAADGTGLAEGAYVVRFKADSLPGFKTAWLLWQDNSHIAWPALGEIDFPEGDLNGTISGYMHHMGATRATQQDAYATNSSYTSWHTAVIEWTPQICRFILDGHVVGTSTSFVPSTAMHWVLQTEDSLDEPSPTPGESGHVYIDWIAAFVPNS